jgi:hypothetical protein
MPCGGRRFWARPTSEAARSREHRRSGGRRWAQLILWGSALAAALGVASGASADCTATAIVGLDSTYINGWSSIGPIPGEALGQTFYAPYTAILSITLWRVWYDTPDASVWRIFIIPVDSTGEPIVEQFLQDGPTLKFTYGDSINPTPFRFVFDPPVQLPSPGTYELAVQGDYCNGDFLIASDGNDDYPDGVAWKHHREEYCLYYPAPFPTAYPNVDLPFRVEFCTDGTPARPTSWGHIKALYH